jgi:hypothetical protein
MQPAITGVAGRWGEAGMGRITLTLAALSLSALVAMPAGAEVAAVSEAGFVIKLARDTPASKTDAWKALTMPSKWWSREHTYSGDAANLYIDSQATGCFCEKLPRPTDAPEGQRMGSIEHMHIVYADPQRGVLRMIGGLGPLQSEAVTGVLTITLKPIDGGTRIEWEYVVGGYMRPKMEQIAPLVDKVLGEQLQRLGALLTPTDGKPG